MYFENDKTTKVENKAYYELFGLDTSASSSDIRKAYKKLLIKCHPDKGGDPKRFQEIQNAYEVLSDPDKKDIYDKYGEQGLKGNHSNVSQTTKQVKKCASLLFTLRIQLEEVYTGVTKELEISVDKICVGCEGDGAKPGSIKYTCEACHGQGVQVVMSRTPFGLVQDAIPCISCNGKGKCVSQNDYCLDCNGKRILQIKKFLKVEVEKGTPDGHKYKFLKEGNEAIGYEAGDVHVEIFLENKTLFVGVEYRDWETVS